MKTSTKIWLIIFIVSTVADFFLARFIFQGIILQNGISFNFSTLGWIGIIASILNAISSTVLFLKFLKTQPFNRLIFFTTIPTTLVFFAIAYYLLTINSYTGNEVEFVRQVLQVNQTNNNQFLWLGLALIIYLTILFVEYHFACKPIKKMEKAISRLSNGRVTDNNIHIGGSNQFLEMEHSLNKINQSFKEKENIIEKTNHEYEKFIPKQFLKFLGKSSVLELELGNQVKKEVTTLNVQMFSSTNVGNSMSLEENFNYVNSYLNTVSPIIRKFGGFVDKYLGDGLIAVFIKPQNALECASAIIKTIENKNHSTKLEPNLEVITSVHTGEVMFGVVGEEERKSFGIISDSINLVNNMQEFNKYFGSKIIFSKRTLNSLKIDYPLAYRYIGALTLNDKEFISLFESLECYDKKKKSKLIDNKTMFEQGVRYFNLGKCHQAKEEFQKVLRNVRDDKVAYMYYNKAEQNVCGEAPLRIK